VELKIEQVEQVATQCTSLEQVELEVEVEQVELEVGSEVESEVTEVRHGKSMRVRYAQPPRAQREGKSVKAR
jgi:hypothetical protein